MLLRYFDHSVRLRQSPWDNAYRLHQHVDTLLQEHMNYRLPYCWYHTPSSIPASSNIIVRTAVQLSISAPVITEIDLVEGLDLTFTTRVFGDVSIEQGRSRKGTWDELLRRFPNSLRLSGFDYLHATQGEEVTYFVQKPGLKRFPIHGVDVIFTVSVNDVQLASEALIRGMGRRKAWGCGLLRDVEIL